MRVRVAKGSSFHSSGSRTRVHQAWRRLVIYGVNLGEGAVLRCDIGHEMASREGAALSAPRRTRLGSRVAGHGNPSLSLFTSAGCAPSEMPRLYRINVFGF